MKDVQHLAHGLAGDHTVPDWPPISGSELDRLFRSYPTRGEAIDIHWHSPRPLSAACLVDTTAGRFFVKRHHHQVRSVETLSEEHRFMAHVRDNGVPIPEVIANAHGKTATRLGDWIYEVHARADGEDLYRETISWTPLSDIQRAETAGSMLATLHNAAEGYQAPQRQTHMLVARSELIRAADPLAMLTSQLDERPGLAVYLRARDWQRDFADVLMPWHAKAQSKLTRQPPLWTHGDWHVSNLCWRHAESAAQVSAVLDFGLCAANFALFDLATGIERNAVAWLNMELEGDPGQPAIAKALIHGYRSERPLDKASIDLLADLLPLVHVDFALSEVEYYSAVIGSQANADVAYETFLLGHAAWFGTAHGQNLLQEIRDCA